MMMQTLQTRNRFPLTLAIDPRSALSARVVLRARVGKVSQPAHYAACPLLLHLWDWIWRITVSTLHFTTLPQ